jgi:uncharacterized lipoprotein YmbA
MRLVAITMLALLLAACASSSPATCYKTQRATAGRDGRALVAYACPSDQQAGAETNAADPARATAG